MENVARLFTHNKGRTKKEIIAPTSKIIPKSPEFMKILVSRAIAEMKPIKERYFIKNGSVFESCKLNLIQAMTEAVIPKTPNKNKGSAIMLFI